MQSVVNRLNSNLAAITERLSDLVREMPIERFQNEGQIVVVGAPDYFCGQLSAKQLLVQLEIKREYEQWFEIFRTVFRTASKGLSRDIGDADRQFRQWVELDSTLSLSSLRISSDRAENEKLLRKSANRFKDILAIVGSQGAFETILVPDTNTIAGEPDPTRYERVAGNTCFVFFLLPTVLGELDTLKNAHRNEDFRRKVQKAIKRIKGWRHQGPLPEGVTVNQTITVRARAIEPDMRNNLSWLDENIRDDRIIASVIELQSIYPAAAVVLVSGDINLLNKADMAWILTAEPPKEH